MNKKILIYQPQSAFIPEDAGIVREPLLNRDNRGRPLDAQDLSRFDSRTLFYDMFFNSGDLVCLGPPLLNLGLPLSIRCEGKELRFRNETVPLYGMPSALRVEADGFRERERLELEFRFRRFTLSASCEAPRAQPPRLQKAAAALATLQKDAPVEWLRDWLLWHHRAHGIRRAVIYDNGSRYFPELGSLLAGLDEGLEIVLIDWPFPYGPVDAPAAKHCRPGALNHFRLFFSDNVRWGVNLDVDEYLYCRDGKEDSLNDILDRPELAARPVIYLGSWWFPGREASRDKAGALPRFFHFRARCAEERVPFWRHHKYIFQLRHIAACGTHEAWTPTSGFHTLRKMFKKFWRRTRAALLRIFQSRERGAPSIADNPLHCAPSVHAALDAKSRKLLLCHFRGLYSGWRAPGKEQAFQDARLRRRPAAADGEQACDFRDVATFPPDWLVEEPRIAETAARFGLTERDAAKDMDADENAQRRALGKGGISSPL